MKTAILAMFAILLIAETEGKRCRKNDFCGVEECCIMRGITGILQGDCRKLAEEGERCSDEEDINRAFGYKYRVFCPCNYGLICESRPFHTFGMADKFSTNNRCVSKAEITSTKESDYTPQEELEITPEKEFEPTPA